MEGGENDAAAVEQVMARFQTFDVKHARCFKEEERQHLLSVIESGFGDLEVFNSVVRHLFTNRLEQSDASMRTGRASSRRESAAFGASGAAVTAVARARAAVPKLDAAHAQAVHANGNGAVAV